MTAAYFAPVPRCPLHTHMIYDRRAGAWTCSGWDGEGCGYTDESAPLEWDAPPPAHVCRACTHEWVPGQDAETIKLAGDWL